MKRIGLDVGGTNTDAILIEGDAVTAAVKSPTTEDVTSGILNSLSELVAKAGQAATDVDAVMIGTTHFTNAVVQRRGLTRVAAIRICLPSCASLDPMIDWPDDLRRAVDPLIFLTEGGHEYDGRPIVPLDEAAIEHAAVRIRDAGIRAVGITAVFSPLTDECETRAAEIVRNICPDAVITLSHRLGHIGLLERENVTLLNACLIALGRKTVAGFEEGLAKAGLSAPFFLTQNDGTGMLAEVAADHPVHSFASGPTNSMRGAAFLTGLENALVVDVGGTTSDIGCLVNGFPREANNVVEVGGVRTLFRMPDLLSLGLGGGTLVDPDSLSIGPQSVGYRLTEDALVFGGGTLTATDVGVAAGRTEVGDASKVSHLPPTLVSDALERVRHMLEEGVDRMKTSADAAPLIAVGGGAFLVPEELEGVSEVLRVENAGVANAVGAAIAQVSGEVDQVFNGIGREAAMQAAIRMAEERAVESGAEAATLKLVEVEDLPIAYLPGDARRVRARVVGDINATRRALAAAE
jgi:N-methylhydantoinase A/oxoprolinase/acetone carboxylase beta subunit